MTKPDLAQSSGKHTNHEFATDNTAATLDTMVEAST